MLKEVIDRRTALGCLVGPFLPAIKLPTKQPEPAKQSFFVEHYDHDVNYYVSLGRGGSFKYYETDTVASLILLMLFDEGRHDSSDAGYGLLEFLWERHDHEAIHAI